MSRISVITPCRNAEKTIERAIKSVIDQDYSDMEYIIIDGNSADSTVQIASRYKSSLSNFKLISEPDRSMTEALNKGIALATGDIICSINADDEYLPGTLEAVAKAFEDSDVDVVVGDAIIIGPDSKIQSISKPKYMNSYFLLCVLDCPTPESSIFFRRSVFEELGNFNEDYRFTQDYEFYLRLTKHGKRYKYLPQALSKFYYSESNITSVSAGEMLSEALSYVGYKRLHHLFKRFRLDGLGQSLLNYRTYPSGYFGHALRKIREKLHTKKAA